MLKDCMCLFVLSCSSATPSAMDGGVDAPSPDAAEAGPACCSAEINKSFTPEMASLTPGWVAWKFVPTCGGTSMSLSIATDAPAVAVLSDANGAPGATLVQESPSTPQGPRIGAVLSANWMSGVPVWIAIKNKSPGSIDMGTLAPFASMGATRADLYSAAKLQGPWMKESPVAPVYDVRICR